MYYSSSQLGTFTGTEQSLKSALSTKVNGYVNPYSNSSNMPFPLAAVIAAGASIYGAVKSSKSQDKANDMNYKIAQMNNEYNKQMLLEQERYNTEMWDKENAYNTASAQVQRYKDAGLNPYLMMSQNGSAGMASTANGVNPPTASEYQYNPVDYSGIASSAISAFNSLQTAQAQTDNLNAQTQGIKIENQYLADKAIAEIMKQRNEANNIFEKTEYQRIANSYAHRNFLSQLANTEAQTNQYISAASLNTAQSSLADLQGKLTQKELDKYDERFLADLNYTLSQTAYYVAMRSKTYAEAEQALQNAAESHARTYGIKLDNGIKQKTARSVMANITWSAIAQEHTARGLYWDKEEKHSRALYAQKDLDMYYWDKGVDYFKDIIGTVGSAAYGGAALKTAFTTARKVKHDIDMDNKHEDEKNKPRNKVGFN